MKVMINRDVDLGLSYTTLAGGKIIIDFPDSEINAIIDAILEEKGVGYIAKRLTNEDLEDILEAFKLDDVRAFSERFLEDSK